MAMMKPAVLVFHQQRQFLNIYIYTQHIEYCRDNLLFLQVDDAFGRTSKSTQIVETTTLRDLKYANLLVESTRLSHMRLDLTSSSVLNKFSVIYTFCLVLSILSNKKF